MKTRRSKLLILSFIGVAFFICLGKWLYGPGAEEKTVELVAEKSLVLAGKSIQPQKVLTPVSETPTYPPSCEDLLEKSLGYDRCDDNCFAARIIPSNKDLSEFIKERWDDDRLAAQEPKSKLGRVYRGYQALGFYASGYLRPKKDYVRAEKLLSSVVREDPNNLFPVLLYAFALKKLGKEVEAKNIFHRTVTSGRYESYVAKNRFELMKAAGTDPLNALKAFKITDNMPDLLMGEFNSELEVMSPDDYLGAMKLIAQKRFSAGNKGRDLLWNSNDDVFARSYLEDEIPETMQRLPVFPPENGFHENFNFFPYKADDKSCNIEDVKENLRVRLEWLKSL